MSAYFFMIIMLVMLVCFALWNADVRFSKHRKKVTKQVFIVVICLIGVMAVFLTLDLLDSQAMYPEIYKPYIMNYYPMVLWSLVSVLMYGVYRRMFS